MDTSRTPSAPQDRILRLRAVLERTGLARSTMYRLIANRRFPAPARIAGRAVGWRQADLERWSASLHTTAH